MISNGSEGDPRRIESAVAEAGSSEANVVDLLGQLAVRLHQIEAKLDGVCQRIADPSRSRDYYSIAEFAELVGKSQYTVREWCRMHRINAEKCETGRGDAKSWKVTHGELERYRNHGLLPTEHLR